LFASSNPIAELLLLSGRSPAAPYCQTAGGCGRHRRRRDFSSGSAGSVEESRAYNWRGDVSAAASDGSCYLHVVLPGAEVHRGAGRAGTSGDRGRPKRRAVVRPRIEVGHSSYIDYLDLEEREVGTEEELSDARTGSSCACACASVAVDPVTGSLQLVCAQRQRFGGPPATSTQTLSTHEPAAVAPTPAPVAPPRACLWQLEAAAGGSGTLTLSVARDGRAETAEAVFSHYRLMRSNQSLAFVHRMRKKVRVACSADWPVGPRGYCVSSFCSRLSWARWSLFIERGRLLRAALYRPPASSTLRLARMAAGFPSEAARRRAAV
jgi:hypothetical protein